MNNPANFKKLDVMVSTLEELIDDLQVEIDELEDKNSERASESRSAKIDKFLELRDQVETAKDALEDARNGFDPENA